MSEEGIGEKKKFTRSAYRPWTNTLAETITRASNVTSGNSPETLANTSRPDYAVVLTGSKIITDNQQVNHDNTTVDNSSRQEYVTNKAENYNLPSGNGNDFKLPEFGTKPTKSVSELLAELELPALDRPAKATFARSHTFNEFNSYLETEINNKQEQKETLLKEVSSSSQNSAMSIGGFFQPSYVTPADDPAHTTKISKLMDDLKLKETEINSLTNDLKISQAMERAEQAEQARKMEEQAKISAENRMKQAIEQADAAAKQLQIAMEKVQQAEDAQREEERQKKISLAQLAELSEQAKNIHNSLKIEQQARAAAEEKAQHALNQTVQIELSRQESEKAKQELELQIQSIVEELRKSENARRVEEVARVDAEQKAQVIFQEKVRLEQIYKEEKTSMQRAFYEEKAKIESVLQATTKSNDEILEKINLMDKQLQEADEKVRQAEGKMQAILEQKSKLQAIVETEKELRILAERKAKDALVQTEQAESARQAAEQRCKLLDERARRAIEHASKTVMQFLNAPLEDGLDGPLSEQKT